MSVPNVLEITQFLQQDHHVFVVQIIQNIKDHASLATSRIVHYVKKLISVRHVLVLMKISNNKNVDYVLLLIVHIVVVQMSVKFVKEHYKYITVVQVVSYVILRTANIVLVTMSAELVMMDISSVQPHKIVYYVKLKDAEYALLIINVHHA